ncbi:MAG: hypothetical protein KKE17_12720, partial [Proteobacteria bacterium]|nr:hypothetical protein [Pseudomonadota bacterium]MBU1710859.1 hypothetical protein [Pseudomonadota bacterium]
YGGKSRPQTFYEDIFLKAFPTLLDDIEETPYQSFEKTIRSTYFYLTLKHFAEFFGLAELRATSENYVARKHEVKKLPFLDQFISFTV